MNVCCIVAHQDDEMGCLGTLLRMHRERGDRISFIVVTNGDKGMSWSPDVSHEEAAAIRAEEMRAVVGAFGGDYVCLNEVDEFLLDTAAVRFALVEAIRTLDTQLIFTHWLNDYNRDHTTTAQLACQSALLTEIASVRTKSPALKRAPAIFHMDPGAGYGFEATHFVTLPDAVVDEKARLIRLHRSQMNVIHERRGRDFADQMADRDRLTGERLGLDRHAEGFRPCLLDRRIPLPTVLPGDEPARAGRGT